ACSEPSPRCASSTPSSSSCWPCRSLLTARSSRGAGWRLSHRPPRRRGEAAKSARLWSLRLTQEIAGGHVHSRRGGSPGRRHPLGQSEERALMLRVVLGRRPRHRRLGGETRAQVRERHLPRLSEEVPVEGGGGGIPRGEEVG